GRSGNEDDGEGQDRRPARELAHRDERSGRAADEGSECRPRDGKAHRGTDGGEIDGNARSLEAGDEVDERRRGGRQERGHGRGGEPCTKSPRRRSHRPNAAFTAASIAGIFPATSA